MKIYIAGKITGDPNYKAKFRRAEKALSKNHTVMNPAILPDGFTHEEYLKICFAMIDVCDWVFMLTDWRESKGATAEYHYAQSSWKNILEYKPESFDLIKFIVKAFKSIFWVFYESKGKMV